MPATSTTVSVGQRLCDLVREGKNLEAIAELYADDIVSIEAVAMENMPQRAEGKEAITGKNKWWFENNDVHSTNVMGPFPHEDRFTVLYEFDTTFKPTGQRMQMTEVALYTVSDGKVSKEEFFYQMG